MTVYSDHPPRLSLGDHSMFSGMACVMELISYETGDRFTDSPSCVARPLASMAIWLNDNGCQDLQWVKDRQGVPRQVLCPKCTMEMIDLGHRMVGTAGTPATQVWQWVRALLDSGTLLSGDEHEDATHALCEAGTYIDHLLAGDVLSLNTPHEDPAISFVGFLIAAPFTHVNHDNDLIYLGQYVKDEVRQAPYRPGGELIAFGAHFMRAAMMASEDEPRGDREAGLAAAHRALDLWDEITGRTPPKADARAVEDAWRKVLAA